MIASTPVALGLRNVYKLWPQTALLLTVVGLVVASSMGILSVRATAQFSAREIASIAMGDADLQARFGGGDISSIVHPEPSHDNGIERVLVDTDVQTTLSGDSGAHSLVGRVVPFRDPLTQGIVKFDRQLAGEGQLALSPTAAAQLDVALGDEVEIASDGGTISLTYTDEVRYAGDTSSPFFLVERESVTAEQVNQIESGIDVGTPRWLIESSDVATAAHYLRSLGLTVVTPSGFSPQAATSLVDTDVFLGGVSLVGFGLLAAATASLAQARRRQNGVLTSVGVDVRSIRAVWVIHAAISAVLGCAVGIVAGYVVTVSGVWWFSRSLNQDMGPLAIAWGSTAVIAAGASLVVLLVSAGTVPLPRRASAPEKPVGAQQLARSHFGGFPSVIARRMRRRSRGVRLVGMVTIAASVALSCASLVTVDVAQERAIASYVPAVRAGDAVLGTSRVLTDSERSALEAGANVRLIEDRRAAFAVDQAGWAVPVYIDSPFTECAREQGVDPCIDAMSIMDGRSTIAVDSADAAALMNRELSAAEREALEKGDGLLLAGSTALVALVAPPGYSESSEDFRREIHPLAVDGFANHSRLPALLISPAAMQEWGLFEDTDPTGHYVAVPQTGSLDESVIRAELPSDLAYGTEVLVESGPPYVKALESFVRGTVLFGSSLVLFVVLLLVAAWAEDSAPQLRIMGALGARPVLLRWVLVLRSLGSILPAVTIGALGAVAVSVAFAAYAGMEFRWSGTLWLLPILCALIGAVSSSYLFAPVGTRTITRASRPPKVGKALSGRRVSVRPSGR